MEIVSDNRRDNIVVVIRAKVLAAEICMSPAGPSPARRRIKFGLGLNVVKIDQTKGAISSELAQVVTPA